MIGISNACKTAVRKLNELAAAVSEQVLENFG
jgi:hypothetical protein